MEKVYKGQKLLREHIGAYIMVLTERKGVKIEPEDIREERKRATKEGLKEGMEEGIASAKIENVEKLLIAKFGNKVKGYVDNVENLSEKKLDYIIEHIFEIGLNEVKGLLGEKS